MNDSLSLPMRRFAAIGLALAAALALASYVIAPAVRGVAQLDEQITAQRELLGRLSALSAKVPEASDAARNGEQLLASEVDLPGETEPIQLANLQALIRRMSEQEGVRLQSTRTLPPTPRDELQLAGLQLTLQAPIEAVQRLLHRIEVHRPILIVDGLDIAPVTAAAAGDGRLLHVDLRVLARVRAARKGATP